MREYVTAPAAADRSDWEGWYWSDTPLLPALQVYEPESGPTPTGLLDHRGQKIYAVERPRRVGFLPIKDF